jgi:excisionase family DNA binding protein
MRSFISAGTPTTPAYAAGTAEADLPLVVTIREASRLLCIGRTTLYKLMGEHHVTTVKVGGASRILRSSLDDYVKKAAI